MNILVVSIFSRTSLSAPIGFSFYFLLNFTLIVIDIHQNKFNSLICCVTDIDDQKAIGSETHFHFHFSLIGATPLSLSFVLIPSILLSFVWLTPFIIWPSIGHWQPYSLSWQKRNTLWQDNACLSPPYPKKYNTSHRMCLNIYQRIKRETHQALQWLSVLSIPLQNITYLNIWLS